MNVNHTGELAALATAFCWTITALTFSSAARKLGSLQLNLIRLSIAFLFLGVFTLFAKGMFLPTDASPYTWVWMSLSGLVGIFLGDLSLFASYLYIPARIAMLIMALAPPIAAVAGYFFLNEILAPVSIVGMALTLLGIALVVLKRKNNDDGKRPTLTFSHSVKGILLAFGGAAGQGLGIVISKHGIGDYHPFAATQIRIIAGIAGFSVLFTVLGRWADIPVALRNRSGMRDTAIGSFFGPFLGISFSMLAVQYTSSGVASTLMAIVPVLILVPAVFIYKEKIGWLEVLGAILSVAGVALLFL